MMNFSTVKKINTPHGRYIEIKRNNKIIWDGIKYRYVSLGDSIAAGHTINGDWERDYGTGSQYGNNGNTKTTIVPNCYTDLIHKELEATYGEGYVFTTSFAKSGDTVSDLIAKLDHAPVREAISKANLVTLCIGANDVLQPAMSNLDQYINHGNLSVIESTVEENLAILNDDSNALSYRALFDKLKTINPKAKFVFTTIYNPYKYLYIEEGKNGFFAPVLNAIPQMTIIGIEVDELIKNGLLNTPAVQTLFSRVNGLSNHAEKFVTKLNTVLRNKINAYGNPNFILADTKAVFDPVPDRPISATRHYNDLVNVEYTRGYNTATMDWGRMYAADGGVVNFWWNLATKYTSTSGLNIDGLAGELVGKMITHVIVPDIDPHPETYGHHALKCSFDDALGWATLPRRTLSFNANGGGGTMASKTIVALDNLTAYTNVATNTFSIPSTGYYFTGWKDANGNPYSNGQLIGLAGNVTLNAQWSNIYTVTFRHSEDSSIHGSDDTGNMECYALWIDGVEQADLGAFSNPARTYQLPYGTSLGVIAQVNSGAARSYITMNGTTVAGKSTDARYGFNLTGHTDIHFEFNYFIADWAIQSYWNCYITT